MSDKRTAERVSLLEYQRVHDAETDAVVGYLGNVTERGLMVLAREAMEPGRRLGLRIKYRRRDGEFETPTLDAECIWCDPPGEGPFHPTGFRVAEPSEQLEKSLATVVADARARREQED